MATRGRFGRLPRAQPTITSTLVAIAREMQATRDRTLMDAWQKGGTFEGRPVTDQMVLAHWRERLKGVDPNDPLADQYKNTLTQYEYAIAESKAATDYAQGKLSDAGMARFYLNWAKKVPKNSEFYRALQRDAAQFMRASAARGRAGAARAKAEAYVNAQEATYKSHIRAGEYLTGVLQNLARANALVGQGADFAFDKFDANDPTRMLELLNSVGGVGYFAGGQGGRDSTGVLYRDPVTGQEVTAAAVQAQLKQLDPSFDGRVNLSYFRGLVRRQIDGYGIVLNRAQANGKKTDANAASRAIADAAEVGRQAAIWPVQATYMHHREAFLGTWLSPTATPDEKMEAWRSYSTQLGRLAADPLLDDNTRSRLMAEVNGEGGVRSLAEDVTGLGSTDMTETTGVTGGDIAETAFDVARYTAMQQAVAAGQAVWTVGVTDGETGAFVPRPGGAEVGAATVADIQAASPVAPAVIFMPQGLGARAIPVVVSGAQITAEARDERGEKVAVTDQNAIGSLYDVYIGGQRTRVYSYRGADGKTYYTADAPWSADVTGRETASGLVLDLSAYVPRRDEAGQWVYANGQPADMSGRGAFGLSEPTRTGQQSLVMSPSRATYLSDPARAVAGPDPATDFFSPTLAALMSSDEGVRTLQVLRDDPVFQQQLQFEAQQAAFNPQTQQLDTSALSVYTTQVQLATHLPEAGDAIVGFVASAGQLWNRLSTRPTFSATDEQTRIGAPRALSGPVGIDAYETSRVHGLPSDNVRGSQFDALASVFEPGASIIKRVTEQVSEGLKLQVSGTLRVPEAPNVTTAPKPILSSVSPEPIAPAPETETPSFLRTTPPPSSGARPLQRPGTAWRPY